MSRYIWNPEDEHVEGGSDFDDMSETGSSSCDSSYSNVPEEEHKGLEGEITRRTLTHTSWDISSSKGRERRGWHPVTYKLADATPMLIQSIKVYRDRSVVTQLVKRAEKAGFKAIVLTVDTPRLGQRESDIKNRFVFPANLALKNFDGLNIGKLDKTNDSGLASYVAGQVDCSLS